jgi:hypothetical protein
MEVLPHTYYSLTQIDMAAIETALRRTIHDFNKNDLENVRAIKQPGGARDVCGFIDKEGRGEAMIFQGALTADADGDRIFTVTVTDDNSAASPFTRDCQRRGIL